MALIVAAVLLLLFVTNVVIGSISGNPPVGVVSEMIVLFAVSIAFVVEILRRETNEKKSNTNEE